MFSNSWMYRQYLKHADVIIILLLFCLVKLRYYVLLFVVYFMIQHCISSIRLGHTHEKKKRKKYRSTKTMVLQCSKLVPKVTIFNLTPGTINSLNILLQVYCICGDAFGVFALQKFCECHFFYVYFLVQQKRYTSRFKRCCRVFLLCTQRFDFANSAYCADFRNMHLYSILIQLFSTKVICII